jgi:hypothetical protein
MILNFVKYGLQLVVLEILAINLIALLCSLKTFLRFLTFPQNKIPYFKDDCKGAKYVVLTIFFANDLVVFIAKQSLLSLIANFFT